MANNILLSLGSFKFSISTVSFESLQKKTAMRWQKQELVGNYPTLQSFGPQVVTLSIRGILLPLFKKNPDALKPLKDMAFKAEPQILVDGLGNVYGKWVIIAIDESMKDFFYTGISKEIDFTIDLQEYRQ